MGYSYIFECVNEWMFVCVNECECVHRVVFTREMGAVMFVAATCLEPFTGCIRY